EHPWNTRGASGGGRSMSDKKREKRAGRRLTKRLIDSLKPKTKAYRVYDADTRGFVLTIAANGAKTFGLRYGTRARRRWVRLGEYGPMTVEQAREQAERYVRASDLGEDPMA